MSHNGLRRFIDAHRDGCIANADRIVADRLGGDSDGDLLPSRILNAFEALPSRAADVDGLDTLEYLTDRHRDPAALLDDFDIPDDIADFVRECRRHATHHAADLRAFLARLGDKQDRCLAIANERLPGLHETIRRSGLAGFVMVGNALQQYSGFAMTGILAEQIVDWAYDVEAEVTREQLTPLWTLSESMKDVDLPITSENGPTPWP